MFKFHPRQAVSFNIFAYLINIKNVFQKDNQKIKELEESIKEIVGCKYVVTTSSMRTGLLKSMEFYKKENPKKNEVIISEYSFHSNLEAIKRNKLKAVLTPIDKKTLNIDPKKIESLITKKTLGIVLTHMHGFMCDMNEISKIAKKHKLIIFEDCAHAHGASSKGKSAGSFGNGFFSFGPGKIITGFGGGAVTTSDKKLAVFLRKQVSENFDIKENIITFIKGFIYIFISNPLFSYLTLKPALLLKYLMLFDKRKEIEENTDPIPKKIVQLSSFQASLLLMQIKNKVIETNVKKRRQIAKEYAKTFKKEIKAGDVCFQFPVVTQNPKKLILKLWKLDLDAQKDYCDFLNKKENNIIYLPTVTSIPLSLASKVKSIK